MPKLCQLKQYKKIIALAVCMCFGTMIIAPAALAVEAETVILEPVASGVTVLSNEKAMIDASNAKDGYIMAAYKQPTDKKLKLRITGPDKVVYTYNLNSDGKYEVFPLSGGEGNYSIAVYENVSGNKYATAYSTTMTVMLTDEYAPYLRANQYVNYQADSEVVKKAAELVKDKPKSLDKIAAVYQYTVTTLTYDKEKAKTVQSGYLPDVDQVLAEQKGICFDYAAVMTAMLRSQGIPTRLVVGYAGDVYHAWINTFIPQTGWIEGVIYFDGETWKMMDPTFASSAKQSKQIMEYIGNGSNYTAKYLY
jgi:hypothetical protein